MAFADIMPIADSLGFTAQQAATQFENNETALDFWVDESAPTAEMYQAIFKIVVDGGSEKNVGGPIVVAQQVGCTVWQARRILDELREGFKYYKANK